MRADRLVSIVLLLQQHGQLTVARLAEMLETSERTIRRDLDALCVSGVPIYSQRGRGGGWSLLNGHRLDLTGLTVDEARALFLVAGAGAGAGAGGGIEGGPSLQSALRKVLAALPEPLREHATAAQGSTVVDPTSWGGRPEAPSHLDALREATLARVAVDIDYAKPGQDPERRRVSPHGIVSKGGVWYLLAGTERGMRTFRISRVVGVEVTGEPVELPDGFDLASEWEAAQRGFLDRMAVVPVEVEVAPSAVLAFTASFGGWWSAEEGEPTATGWRRFVISAPHERAATRHLAHFGADVRVVSPAAVREELARIGRGLVAAHGGREQDAGTVNRSGAGPRRSRGPASPGPPGSG